MYSESNMEAESDASGNSQSSVGTAQVRVAIKMTWVKDERRFRFVKECQLHLSAAGQKP